MLSLELLRLHIFFLAEGFKLLEVVSDGLEVIQLLF